MKTLDEVLKYLVTGGASVVVGWGASWFLEGEVWWHKLSSNARKLIIWGASILLSFGAVYIINMPAEKYAVVKPYLEAVVATTLLWVSMQVAHRKDSERIKDG